MQKLVIRSASGNIIAPMAPPPSSVPPPLTMTAQNFVKYHLILPLSLSRSLTNFNSCRYCYRKKNPTRLLTAYNWFSIITSCRSTQTSEASPIYTAENWADSLQEPTLPVREGQLGSHCFGTLQVCPVLPQNPKRDHCYTISVYFFVILVSGCGRSFSKGPVVMDI